MLVILATINALTLIKREINMKNPLLFLSSFVAISWFFLSGFAKPSVHHIVKQKIVAESVTTGQNDSTSEQADWSDKEKPTKPLDLSVPFKANKYGDNATGATAPDKSAQNLFTPEPKKTTQPLQLKGGLLMSPEPEVEKSKSVDGAGIVINVKP
jgi:hypothetical protein